MSRLILLPGLGADARMFAAIGDVCRPLVTPRMPVPGSAESLARYARRIAARLGVRAADYVGGCSFGALVASEIARQRHTAGLILLAGATSSAFVWPGIGRWMRAALSLPAPLLRSAFTTRVGLGLLFGPMSAAHRRLIAAMLKDTPDAMLLGGGRLATSYFPVRRIRCPVHAVHGARDRILRAPPDARCELLTDAGHALVITHAAAVTRFLRSLLC